MWTVLWIQCFLHTTLFFLLSGNYARIIDRTRVKAEKRAFFNLVWSGHILTFFSSDNEGFYYRLLHSCQSELGSTSLASWFHSVQQSLSRGRWCDRKMFLTIFLSFLYSAVLSIRRKYSDNTTTATSSTTNSSSSINDNSGNDNSNIATNIKSNWSFENNCDFLLPQCRQSLL